jgi:hypothetical protein
VAKRIADRPVDPHERALELMRHTLRGTFRSRGRRKDSLRPHRPNRHALSSGEVAGRALFSPGLVKVQTAWRHGADILSVAGVSPGAGCRQRLLSGAMLRTYTHYEPYGS